MNNAVMRPKSRISKQTQFSTPAGERFTFVSKAFRPEHGPENEPSPNTGHSDARAARSHTVEAQVIHRKERFSYNELVHARFHSGTHWKENYLVETAWILRRSGARHRRGQDRPESLRGARVRAQ